MSILLITDTQLGMALKNIKFGRWTKKALDWKKDLDPSEKEIENLNKFIQFSNKHNPDFIIHTGDIINEIDKPSDLSNYKSLVNKVEHKIKELEIESQKENFWKDKVLVKKTKLDELPKKNIK